MTQAQAFQPAQGEAMLDAAEDALALLNAAAGRIAPGATKDETFALVSTACAYLMGLHVGRHYGYPADVAAIGLSLEHIKGTAAFLAGQEAGRFAQSVARKRTRKRTKK